MILKDKESLIACKAVALAFLCFANCLSAATFGLFTYTDNGTYITITDYPTTETGDVVIPDTIAGKSVTTIGSYAFRDCANLTSITIPASVTIIGSYAFYGCSSLASIMIPASVNSIGSYAFYGCGSLASITVDPLNSAYSSVDGMLFNKSQTTLIQCPGGKVETVAIPSSVTTIGASAFSGCSSLTTVTIPSGVTSMGDLALSGCWSLTGVIIPFSVTTIGASPFLGCSGLTDITVDPLNVAYSSVDGILYNKGQTTLIECPGGKTGSVMIPSSVTTIGTNAFNGCGNLAGITIPTSVTSIGTFAFRDCGSLASAIFKGVAPSVSGTGWFASFGANAAGFAVYYFDGKAGFTSPKWMGYPVVNMGGASPVSPWLVANGFPHDTDVMSDLNDDGVNLLMAYALALDPRQNLSGSIPRPVIAGDQMSLQFHAASEGITYRVETSANLQNWSAEDVILSAPDANGYRTAWFSGGGPNRFIRLAVSR